MAKVPSIPKPHRKAADVAILISKGDQGFRWRYIVRAPWLPNPVTGASNETRRARLRQRLLRMALAVGCREGRARYEIKPRTEEDNAA